MRSETHVAYRWYCISIAKVAKSEKIGYDSDTGNGSVH